MGEGDREEVRLRAGRHSAHYSQRGLLHLWAPSLLQGGSFPAACDRRRGVLPQADELPASPHAVQIPAAQLPRPAIRYAEYGTVYRYEPSGQLHGLMRVRGFTQNDAHIYCTRESAKEEFVAVMRLHQYYYDALGLRDYHMVLALRDPKNTNKYHGDDAMWEESERLSRAAMEESGIPYVDEVGSAAHYGPKADFVIRSVTGRQFAASTNQLDLYMPHRFGLTYVDRSGGDQHVVILHRAPLGSHERFVGFLIEHFAG